MGIINGANIKKTIYYLKRNGVRNTWYAAKERMEEAKRAPYSYEAPDTQELDRQRNNPLEYKGVISIVVPTYHTVPEYLRELIISVLNQTYPYWELILADASSDDSVEKVAGSYCDERIKYVRLGKNEGIAQNTNRGLEFATGEYIGLLDHDDVLTEDALYEMARAIECGKKEGIEVRMLYSDEDKCNSDRSEYYEPNWKEKFNLDLLLSNNYICHFLVMESTLMKQLGFRPEYDGAQDYDLVLRAAEHLMADEEQIVHISRVLYHWRCHTGSTAENPQSKQYAYEAGLRALQDFADRLKWSAKAEHLKHLGFYKLTYMSKNKGQAQAILANRKDIAAVGGRLLHKGRTSSGRMTETGVVVYQGLHTAYSGYLHRAVLSQDAEVIDIRVISLQRECIPIFEKIAGVAYKEDTDTGLFDASLLPRGTDYKKLSMELCKALRLAGYRILYQPSIMAKER
uniref:glycosyltransferase family 2 protein n=1 Tax=Acetatifactor sp. TaxID=1872090 RepID=UPI004056EDCC